MGVSISRFYKREQWKLDCEIITPMFLGNAGQEAELRAAPFKALLRYWWRVANGAKFAPGDHESLLTAENKMFGSPDEKSGAKSNVTVAVHGTPACYPAGQFPKGQQIPHPEVKPHGKPINIDRFLYLGYGPVTGKGSLNIEGEGAFYPEQLFRIILSGKPDILEKLKSTLHCWQQFGAIGGRSRNGWGCFTFTCDHLPPITDGNLFKNIATDWQSCLSRDYPHSLGLNDQQLLLWRCKNIHANWQGVMNELAEIYMKTRLVHKFQGGGPHQSPQSRHALGYPAGKNHSVQKWGNQGRHGSALRLLVRKETDGHRGYILHLPHLFSDKMWPNGKSQQIEIWQQVHRSLDALCDRSPVQEGG